MNLKDGKQLEKLLVGEVRNTVKETRLIREGIINMLNQRGESANEEGLQDLIRRAIRLPDYDRGKREIFSSAIRPIRRKIERNTTAAYSAVRSNQINETEALAPTHHFSGHLLDDLEEALEDVVYDSNGDQIYELRLYTAIGSELDEAKSVDFWVELKNLNTGKPVAKANIDIKTNPNANTPTGLADMIYYFDPKYNDDELESKINPNAFEDSEYKELVKKIDYILRGNLH